MIIVREFNPKDMFAVIKLASDALTEKYNPTLFNYFYETNPEGFLVAEENHKIMGFIIGVKINNDLTKILMLSVSESKRRKKIGSLLLKEYITKLNETSTNIIELEVRVDNNNAIRFYEHHGFKIISEIKDFYQDQSSAYTMRLLI